MPAPAVEGAVDDPVVAIVREILERRQIDRPILVDADLREIGLTSLDLVNLMLSVETEFGCKIPDADMTLQNFRSVAAIHALLNALAPDRWAAAESDLARIDQPSA